MNVNLIPVIDEIKQGDLLHKTVIVIDVLRASSTIVTALQRGFSSVWPVKTVGEAKECDQENRLLAGERYGKKIPGFTLDNSPTQLLDTPVTSTLVLTTTNGTRAVQKASKADDIFIGCFLNGRHCAKTAYELHKDITLLCAGARGTFALEDGLAAGFILDELGALNPDLRVNDLGKAMTFAFHHSRSQLTDTVLQSSTGRHLTHHGFEDDIRFCCSLNTHALTPRMKKGHIIGQP